MTLILGFVDVSIDVFFLNKKPDLSSHYVLVEVQPGESIFITCIVAWRLQVSPDRIYLKKD